MNMDCAMQTRGGAPSWRPSMTKAVMKGYDMMCAEASGGAQARTSAVIMLVV